MKKRLIVCLSAGLLIVFAWLAIGQGRMQHYPWLVIQTPEDHRISFLLTPRRLANQCQQATESLKAAILASCPLCRAVESNCATDLNPLQQDMLSGAPLDQPSATFSAGTILYGAPTLNTALDICKASETQAAGNLAALHCHEPGISRHQAFAKKIPQKAWMYPFMALVLAALASWLICWLIIRYEHLHAHLSHDHTDSGPQKFHAEPTPRIGGLALAVGLLAASALLDVLQPFGEVVAQDYRFLLLASIPAFFGGLAEDITKKLGVLERLVLTMLAGAVAAWLLGAILDRAEIPFIADPFQWLPFAVVFTIFAVGGVANAINIIDGYNGLAGGFSVIVLAAISWVAWQVGDGLVVFAALAMAGALIGFLMWNWPGGNIFLGDGGAYLLGFILAELSVLLVVRNPQVSLWFPVLLLAHPVFETLFSIYRRKFLRGHTPGHPDALHLHQLIYSRLVRIDIGTKDPAKKAKRNSMTSPYLWFLALACAVPGILIWRNPWAIQIAISAYCALYIWLYLRIADWRAPGFLRTCSSGESIRNKKL